MASTIASFGCASGTFPATWPASSITPSIRALKSAALHFQLDLRRPEIHRTIGMGAPGRRQTLPELVRGYLAQRPLPAELDREAFVRLGESLMDAVERDLAGA